MIIIGVDPHKASHTAEAIDANETALAQIRVGADRGQVERLVAWAAPFPDRRWAVEGANGVGRLLAQQLVAAGERVVDVPATLAARVRVLNGLDKTDAHDASSVAVAALRRPGLRTVQTEDHAAVLHLLSERRAQLVAGRTQTVSRLHTLLRCLVPGGAKRCLTVAQARTVLRDVRPTSEIERQRKTLARELVAEMHVLEGRIKRVEHQIKSAVDASGSTLTEIAGVGPVLAAKILGIVGDATRFENRAHFASYAGVSPIEASSGAHVRHRLNRRGNRQLNYAIHMVAVTQRAHPGLGRDYFERKTRARQESGRGSPCAEAPNRERDLQTPSRRHPTNRVAARGDNTGRLQPARPAHTRTPTLRDSHPRTNPNITPTLDREAFGSAVRNRPRDAIAQRERRCCWS